MYFWLTSVSADYKSANRSKRSDQRSFLCSWPPRAPRGSLFSHHGRTSPAFVNKYRQTTILILTSVNSGSTLPGATVRFCPERVKTPGHTLAMISENFIARENP